MLDRYSNINYGSIVARDDIGRELPLADEVGSIRKNKHVGIFYFLWLGEQNPNELYNISEILEINPKAGYEPESKLWGKYGVYHHWGEPFYGYYFSKDTWVIRKHIEMLTLANVDFLVFDTTNDSIYEHNAKILIFCVIA